MNFEEIDCKTALNKISGGRMPYQWDLNIYRGCQHGCKYCFALYTHKYLDCQDYFNTVFVKQNIVEVLEKKLASKSWKKEIINIGGVTDSYQPCEAEFRIMPQILELMIQYKNPCIISSKSNLILRDYDLIEKLSDVTMVNIAQTITAMDESVREKLEPGGAKSLERFEVLEAFGQTRATTGLHCMPLVPFLTDNAENIEQLCYNGARVQVDYIIISSMNLKGETRRVFLDFIRKEYPERLEPLLNLYKGAYAQKEYRNKMRQTANKIRVKHGLSANYKMPLDKRLAELEVKQLSLFD